MSLATDMHQLTRAIVGAAEVRATALDGLRTATAEELEGFRKERRRGAKELRNTLHTYARNLRKEVASFRKETAAAHRQMASEQRSALETYVGGLESDIAQLIGDLAAGRKNMADELRTGLGGYVEGLRHEVEDFRGELQADQAAARQAWTRLVTRKRRPARGAPAPQKRARAERPAAAEEDLKVIQGVGPAMERRLKDAGITNLTKLATSTAAGIRKALGGAGRLADVDRWIAEARRLTK